MKQRRQRPKIFGTKALLQALSLNRPLDQNRVDEQQAVLQQLQRQRNDLLLFAAIGGQFALTAITAPAQGTENKVRFVRGPHFAAFLIGSLTGAYYNNFVASVEIETAEGPIFVEIRPKPGLGAVTADPEEVIAKAGESLEKSLALVQRIAKAVSSKLQDTKARSAEVTFSVKITGKGKFVVAEAAGEAHLQVKLTLDTGGHQSTGT